MSFETVDQSYEKQDFKKCYDQLKSLNDDGERSCDLYWRLCRVCHDLSTGLPVESKKRVILEGRQYGLQAVELDPSNAMAAKWAAILYGMSVDQLATKAKIEEGGKLKDMLDRALDLNPGDFALLHLRGRFQYTLANLSWLERKAAAVLYAEVPKASIEDALVDFEAAFRAQSDWIENCLYLAKCYLAKKDKTKAKEMLTKAIALPVNSHTEKDLVGECRKLVEKC